jgi:hypothetical protein
MNIRRHQLIVEQYNLMTLLLETRQEALATRFLPRIKAAVEAGLFDRRNATFLDGFISGFTNQPVDEIDSDKKAEFLLQLIWEMDPDPKKSHVQWMLNKFLSKNVTARFLLEDLPSIKTALERYIDAKTTAGHLERLTPEQRDINRFKSANDLIDLMAQFRVVDEKTHREMLEQCEIILDDSNYLIVSPKTMDAAIYFGRNTEWCTAYDPKGDGRTNNMFDYYAKEGPLVIVIDLRGDSKWQFHYESDSYMDEMDRSIDVDDWVEDHPIAALTIRNLFGSSPVIIAADDNWRAVKGHDEFRVFRKDEVPVIYPDYFRMCGGYKFTNTKMPLNFDELFDIQPEFWLDAVNATGLYQNSPEKKILFGIIGDQTIWEVEPAAENGPLKVWHPPGMERFSTMRYADTKERAVEVRPETSSHARLVMDSSKIRPEDWDFIAKHVRQNYKYLTKSTIPVSDYVMNSEAHSLLSDRQLVDAMQDYPQAQQYLQERVDGADVLKTGILGEQFSAVDLLTYADHRDVNVLIGQYMAWQGRAEDFLPAILESKNFFDVAYKFGDEVAILIEDELHAHDKYYNAHDYIPYELAELHSVMSTAIMAGYEAYYSDMGKLLIRLLNGAVPDYIMPVDDKGHPISEPITDFNQQVRTHFPFEKLVGSKLGPKPTKPLPLTGQWSKATNFTTMAVWDRKSVSIAFGDMDVRMMRDLEDYFRDYSDEIADYIKKVML